ncbi:MAG: LamB/YcsF family protein [Puniceicoccaceae bacterium]|nr:MAG: LamB/YcsF family protein [Puniceicoccaceae bacterium]
MCPRRKTPLLMDQLMLNCDLGEDESPEKTRQLLALVDAANVSCGHHAGSPEKTDSTLRDAQKAGVRIGAHPGLSAAGGRGEALPTEAAFAQLLEEQIGSFGDAASRVGVKVDYIKLHGSLYHGVESQPALAEVYLDFLRRAGPGMAVVSLAGGIFARRCQDAGITVYREAFADRAYRADGSLVPRSEADAVLSTDAALRRLRHWLASGEMPTQDGLGLALAADTLCVHGDHLEAIPLIHGIRTVLASNDGSALYL